MKFVIVSISSRSDGDEQQVDLPEDPRHLLRDPAAQAVGLDVVDGREEPRLPEDVRPRVGDLHLQLVEAVRERQLLEGRRRLGEEDRVERAVRPVRQLNLDGNHAELPAGLERRAVDVRRRALLHPAREVADLEALRPAPPRRSRDGSARSRRRPGRGPRSPARTSIVSSTPRVIGPSLSSDQQSVIAPVRGTRPKVGRRPVDAAAHRGLDDAPPVSLPIEKPTRPAAVAAPGPALAAARALLEEPRVHRLAAEPDVVQRQRAEAELRHEHGARLVQRRATTAESASGTRLRYGSAP